MCAGHRAEIGLEVSDRQRRELPFGAHIAAKLDQVRIDSAGRRDIERFANIVVICHNKPRDSRLLEQLEAIEFTALLDFCEGFYDIFRCRLIDRC